MAEVAYDPYRIKYLEAELAEAGVDITLIPHGQGFRQATESGLWMPRSLELLEDLIGKRKLRVKANPALFFAAASAVQSPDPKGNLIYDKRASSGRIDGLVALAMAVGAAAVSVRVRQPEYQLFLSDQFGLADRIRTTHQTQDDRGRGHS